MIVLPSFVSCVKVQKMIKRGCMAWIKVLRVEKTKEKDASEVLVVKEFLDVFPKDLSRLPQNKEIKFTIDLIPGTKPISIPPYCMAPIELKELKIQLQ